MRDYLMLGIAIASPFVAILIGYFLNSSRVDRLETRMDAGFTGVNTRIDGVLRDFGQFHASASNLDTRVDAHHERIGKLEEKVRP